GVAYRGAFSSAADHSRWSQCGWVDQPATGRRPRSSSHRARAARSATLTAGSISRQPPSSPATIVVVVVNFSAVATYTPAATLRGARRPESLIADHPRCLAA